LTVCGDVLVALAGDNRLDDFPLAAGEIEAPGRAT
jgi:hypothetical protein